MVEQTDVPSEWGNVNVVVFDSCHYPSPPKKSEMVLALNITGEDLIKKFAEEMGYPKDAFEVKWKQTIIEPEEQKTLQELGFNKKETIHIHRRPGVKEIESRATVPAMLTSTKTASPSSVSSSSSMSSTSHALVPTYGPSPSPSTYTYPSTGYSSYSWSQHQTSGKSSTGYIGLSNQGATCYMNSLIQTLYMTPEFRNAIYNWSFDEKFKSELAKAKEKDAKEKDAKENGNGNGNTSENGTKENGNGAAVEVTKEEREKKEKTSIPLQLQRLFARLQLCDVQAVKTKDLTKSFGWEDADSFTQHDVQELCRVLFDALERNFQGTKQSNLVNELYQGKMKDYVQCKECKHESARVDHYLDIPLVIRGFGETIPVKSVEEALYKFVQPEVLDKENQYNCEKCAKKVDAIKGLKIEKFPYLLTLQLKRFDFDFQTMRRVKLNDRVTFPLYLDLNPIIHGKRAPSQKRQKQNDEYEDEDEDEDEEEQREEQREEKEKGRAEDQDDEPGPQPREDILVDLDDDDDRRVPNHSNNSSNNSENFDAEPDFDAPPPVVTAELPYVYELFSVMIHRGSSMGGHYYAYVKSFETNKWYEFNDSIVSEISVQEVKKAFGGDDDGGIGYSRTSMYSSYRSTANAYMLMYRQIAPDRNKKPMTPDEIPEAVKKIVDDENGAAKEKKKAEEREREMVKLKIYYNGEDKQLSAHKNATLSETAKAAVDLFGLHDKIVPGNFRLRGYSHYNDLPGDTYTGKENKTLEDLNFYAYSYPVKNLLLETKEPYEEFEDYDAANMLFRVAKYNPETLGFDPVVNVYVNKYGTFGDLREAVGAKLGIPKDKMNLYREPISTWHSPPATLLEKANDVELRSTHISEPEKLYAEFTEKPKGICDSDDEDDDKKERENDDDDDSDKKEKEEDSPVIAALERIKNIIEVKFNLPGKEDADQKISVDKNMLVKDFKQKLQPIIGLALDDFKIKRGSAPHLYELSNENESLSDFSIRDGMSLTIEQGKPLKEGETIYTFELLDLTKDADHFTELFDFAVHEDMLISDVKKTILPMLLEKGITVPNNDHLNLRLREISSAPSRRIGKVFPDALSVKKAMVYVYSKRMLIQVIDGPETVVNQDKDICFFIQLFKPSTFELTRKEDFVISEDASLDELREKLGVRFNIPPADVGILRVDTFYNFHDDPNLLEVPELNWDRPTIAYSTKNTVGESMMMRHGYLLLVRDNTEKLKELTKEEKEAIKKDTMKKKNAQNSNSTTYSFWNRKERALKIQSEG